jgi:hypothetical protein
MVIILPQKAQALRIEMVIKLQSSKELKLSGLKW